MSMNDSRSSIGFRANNTAAHTFNQLQDDLVSRARLWAVDEVSAAIAHQTNEPLTALLLHLHEIKDRSEHATGTDSIPIAVRNMVEMALRETERVCEIMERLGQSPEVSINAEMAVARGREAIESWGRNGGDLKDNRHTPPVQSHAIQHRLTPREREALDLITGGASNREGGRQMGIATRTFEVHRAHIMRKLGARNAADLVRMALSKIR